MTALLLNRGCITFSIMLGVTCLAGCGGAEHPLAQVKGTVTRDGKPMEHIMVHFLPNQGRPSWGVTDAQGRYTMEYTDRKGVEIAQHKVYVTFSPQDIQVKMDLEFGKYKVPPEIKEILKKYGDPETTPLTYDVQESQTIDLALD